MAGSNNGRSGGKQKKIADQVSVRAGHLLAPAIFATFLLRGNRYQMSTVSSPPIGLFASR